jgi:small conductance mechanosensitive channel
MTLSVFAPQQILSALVISGVEAVVLLLVFGVLHVATKFLLSRLGRWGRLRLDQWGETAQLKVRNILLVSFVLSLAGVLAFNGWLLATRLDMKAYAVALIGTMVAAAWGPIAIAAGKLALAAAAIIAAALLSRRLLARARVFASLNRLIVATACFVLIVFAWGWLALPPRGSEILLFALRVYLLIAIGVMIVRCTALIVDALDAFSLRSSREQGWASHYDQVRPLLPTLRLCLEYALWIGIASLVFLQFGALRGLSWWGLRLVEAIGIFFAGRVVIELGALEIARRMLPDHGLEDAERRRRATLVPLVRSTFVYAGYFAVAVLILSALGFNAMPFLAGAGILGVVIGFGAQSLIDDLVSGFFILLENNYLVGDVIEVGPAKGVVEAIEFRTTKIRDTDGRLHVLRNGAIKPIVNYSKDYAMAVVPVEVAYDADLRGVFTTLRHAGERVRAANSDVLADTVIDGITAFGVSSMTVRTSTRVKPGRHEGVAAALRLQIKEMFDRQAPAAPRNTLIPSFTAERSWPPAGQGV